MNDDERFVREQIAAIHREYNDRIKPWIDQLVRIESLKPPKPIWFDASRFPGVDIDAAHNKSDA